MLSVRLCPESDNFIDCTLSKSKRSATKTEPKKSVRFSEFRFVFTDAVHSRFTSGINQFEDRKFCPAVSYVR